MHTAHLFLCLSMTWTLNKCSQGAGTGRDRRHRQKLKEQYTYFGEFKAFYQALFECEAVRGETPSHPAPTAQEVWSSGGPDWQMRAKEQVANAREPLFECLDTLKMQQELQTLMEATHKCTVDEHYELLRREQQGKPLQHKVTMWRDALFTCIEELNGSGVSRTTVGRSNSF